jgi:glutathione S-transferase
MLTLYYKPTCPFSQDVLGQADILNIKLDLKDIASNLEYRTRLIDLGGKKQTPFLVDPERGEQMYESNDIIAYLATHYANKQESTFGGLRVHKSEEVCDTCQ